MCLSDAPISSLEAAGVVGRNGIKYDNGDDNDNGMDGNDSNSNSNSNRNNKNKRNESSGTPNCYSSFGSFLVYLCGGIALGVGTTVFSLHFPHFLTPDAANAIYLPAFYNYDSNLSHFDNSPWTYVTDYLLAIVMLLLAKRTLSLKTNGTQSSPTQKSQQQRQQQLHNHIIPDTTTTRLKYRLAGLMLLYAASVTAGGLAHQFYTTLQHRNSWSFRVLWTICVGTVTAAGGMMGTCASEVAYHYSRKYPNNSKNNNNPPSIIVIPEAVWIGMGAFLTLICIMGWISYQRPACDIFIAGVSQSPPSFYMMGIAYSMMSSKPLTTKHDHFQHQIQCWKCLWSFIMNAPLLPSYALALYCIPNVSLPVVNTALHLWLCISWSMQGNTIHYFIQDIILLQQQQNDNNTSNNQEQDKSDKEETITNGNGKHIKTN